MAEIVRSGLLSVDPGQKEAAYSLGMTPARTIRRIILPQAFRVIIPPTGNEIIGMLKATSLVSILAISDLLYSVEGIYGRNFKRSPCSSSPASGTCWPRRCFPACRDCWSVVSGAATQAPGQMVSV